MKGNTGIGLLLICCGLLCASSTPAQVVISEFMTANATGIVDESGAHSDWIEIYNHGVDPVILHGYYLTDDPNWPNKWQFPEGLPPLQPNSYLLVWASGQNKVNPANPLHTNFKLAREGGYLALVDLDFLPVSSFDNYPPQYPDVSYGRDRIDPTLTGYFHNPSPGAQNVNGLPLPVFSHETGVYTNTSISLTISSAGGSIRYTTDGSLPTTNSPLYSGPIVLATNATVKARVFPPSLAGDLPSVIASRNFIFLDNTTSDFNSNLPLLIVSTEGRPIQTDVPSGGSRTKGSIAVIDVKNAQSSPRNKPDVQVLAGFEYFGQTAIGFPKKPIRVETQDAYGNDQRVSILGLPPGSDFRLRNPYNDKSFLNEVLSTELYEQMGRYSVRRRYVEAFVDSGGGRLNYTNDYYGIMVLFEGIQIDQDRLDLKRISPTATNEPGISGGYIFKKDKDTPGDLGFTTSGGNGFSGLPLKMHDPKPNDLRVSPGGGPLTAGGTAQLNYLKGYLNAMENALYAPNWRTATGTNHYSYYLDADSFVDFHWMVEFAKYVDGHRISTFFYKDRGGKVTAGPVWGWNLGFGNANYLLAGQTNGWYYDQIGQVEHGWMRQLIDGSPIPHTSNGDPDFVQKIADRWSQLRTNILSGNRLLARIDELATYLDGAVERDLAKYQTLGKYMWAQPDGGVATAGSVGSIDGRDVDFVRPLIYHDSTTNSIIGQLKKYIYGRYLWIDSQFTTPPVIHASSGLVSNGFSVTLTAKPGVQVYYTLDGSDPRGPSGTTNGVLYTGPIVVSGNVQIMARARGGNTWQNTWSGPSRATLYTSVPDLRITEIMYHPADLNAAANLEYIELKNTGTQPLNVNGFSLSGGIQFLFPAVTLQAQQRAVVVKNAVSFQSRYGTIPGLLVLGEFDGQLSDSGDDIVLRGRVGEPILDFAYDDKWYPTTDGLGFSLVIRDDNAPASSWSQAAGWRPSNGLGGSPGQSEPASTMPSVLINEVLANNPSGPDVIELYNAADSALDIGGWFLSDDFRSPSKYVVPANTIIPAKGYYLFYGTNSFSLPANGLPGFGLGSKGDDVWLFSGNGTNLTGYAHGFTFGASPSGRSLGRHVISTGAEHFVLQAANTLGGTNAGPAIGPIVITEINANPPNIGVNGSPYSNTRDEYIELHNITGVSAPLYDPAYPTNTWHLQGAVQFAFPQNAQIPPNGFALVVGFDPAADSNATAAFRERNTVPESTSLFGPWSGQLSDESATLQLVQPAADGSAFYLIAEQVHYSNQLPWPGGWNATGLTLQKINPAAYSDDPANWFALFRNPGATKAPSGTPPIITSQPQDQIVPTGKDLTLAVTASGTDPHYQWRKNGFDIPSATNSLLVLSNFQSSMAGRYNILVYNSAGATLGDEFSVSSRGGLRLLTNPAPRIVLTGATTNIPVAATGTGPIIYQWRRNGALIDATNVFGAQSATLVISNAQPFNEGLYTVTITDDYDSFTSEPVSFAIGYRPVFVLQPLSQEVVQGGSVTLSVAATGTTPMTFRWRKQAGTFVYNTLSTHVGETNSFFTITNFQLADATNYSVALSNVMGFATGGPFSGRSFDATLTLLADTDQDGLPDSWENGRAGFSVTDASDASRDDDGDGMSNLAEFNAGTDYLNAQSYLKVNIGPAGKTISFLAVSNRTYSILQSDVLGSSFTQRLADFPAFATNSVRTIVDPMPSTNRFYRLVTPHQP